MSEEKNSYWLHGFLDKHLFAIVCGSAVIWSGYNSSNAITSHEIDTAKRERAEIKGSLNSLNGRLDRVLIGRRGFMKEAGDRIDFMCERNPECVKRFGPLDVPE